MREVIEKAIANGFIKRYPKDFKPEGVISFNRGEEWALEGRCTTTHYRRDGSSYELENTICKAFRYGIYKLIFKKELGFIEALIGKRRVCLHESVGLCDEKPKNKCTLFDIKNGNGECEYCTDMETTLHFIRSDLANMTLDEMKECLRGLV
jgi:hypothetical protein